MTAVHFRASENERRLKSETEKLEVYRRELVLLQRDMNKEVVILQSEIDTEVRDLSYLEAEFRDLEKHYLEMRATVAKKRERKEMLTAHLATIISHHELRRADRLNELMSRMSQTSGSGSGGSSGNSAAATSGGFSGF